MHICRGLSLKYISDATRMVAGTADSSCQCTEWQLVAADDKTDHHPARVASDRGPRLRLSQRPGWAGWPAALKAVSRGHLSSALQVVHGQRVRTSRADEPRDGDATGGQGTSKDPTSRPTHNALLHLALERSVRGLECTQHSVHSKS